MQRIGENGRFNAQLFGVPADGATNATTAIHALRTLAGTGTVLHFPAGDYLVSPLAMTIADQVWDLAPGATFTLANGANADMIVLSAAGATLTGRGMFDGNKANQSGTARGIRITGDNVTVDGPTIRNAFSYGVYASNCQNLTLRNVASIDAGNIGIFVEANVSGSADMRGLEIAHCLVDRESIASASVAGGGIQVHGYSTAPYEILGARIVNNDIRLPTNPTASSICIEVWHDCPRAVIAGNTTSGGSMGISVDGSDFSAVTGNTVYGQKANGIEIAGSEYCAVSGNAIDGNALGTVGIICSNSNTGYNSITGNVVSGCTSRAIKVQTSPFSTVSGNVVKQAAGYAVEILSSSDDCTIVGNAIDGQNAATKAIVLDTTDEVTVTGNRMADFTQHGIFVTASTSVTLVNIALIGNSISNCNVPIGSSFSGGAAYGAGVRSIGNANVTSGGKSYDVLSHQSDVKVAWGSGSPEGVVTAGIGSVYHRTDGGAGTSQYKKESGTGSTGWVAF